MAFSLEYNPQAASDYQLLPSPCARTRQRRVGSRKDISYRRLAIQFLDWLS